MGSYGDNNGMFHTPVGLAIDNQGNLFVADSGKNTIQEFNTHFGFMNEFKSLLTGDGNFTAANGITTEIELIFQSRTFLFGSFQNPQHKYHH